ncbi:hypothetical protein JB92DRAFT_3101023 [Gautieria morchelliformis]|nr:hypothetical protein JB92DRAFT_3101023 [Gautieria morchelliformis]
MLLADVGARPPATLYQTHLVTSPERGSSRLANANPPQRPGTASVPGTLPVVQMQRNTHVLQMQRNTNPNVSAYQGKTRRRHQEPRRPGTGDSSQALLAEDWAVAAAASLVGGVESRGRKGGKDKKTVGAAAGAKDKDKKGAGVGAGGKDKDKDKKGDKDKDKDKKAAGLSHVYMFYRHSLNSLTDIVDKDDMASLAELHHYLNRSGSGSASSSSYSNDEDDDADNAPSASPLARRRSLPARTSVSLLSLASTSPTASTLSRDPDPTLAPPSAFSSTFSFAPPHPDLIFMLSTSSLSPTRTGAPGTGTPADPQRRKRAAKLARFFGVESNCRALFRDVLASLEEGVREEGEEGRLGVDEVEDLLGTLRNLEVRRNQLTA